MSLDYCNHNAAKIIEGNEACGPRFHGCSCAAGASRQDAILRAIDNRAFAVSCKRPGRLPIGRRLNNLPYVLRTGKDASYGS